MTEAAVAQSPLAGALPDELAARVASSDCTVLITGESGAGKEVVARHLHGMSRRANGPFVAVNCAALPEQMLEALLFGWERGAFTGAVNAHAGKFECAQGGTLLLDEISELPLSLQAKLLRVLQERELDRLGGRAPLALDVRVFATSNRDLVREVSAGRFRRDLYYRLAVFPLHVAPLRERATEIVPLAMRLLVDRLPAGARLPALAARAAARLTTWSWPGNVRELDNVLQRALILLNGPVIEPEHLHFEALDDSDVAPAAAPRLRTAPALAAGVEHAERALIFEALRSQNGSRRAAAERLGISARTLRYKLARLRAAGVPVPA
jgi:two-component system response regulator FlrC